MVVEVEACFYVRAAAPSSQPDGRAGRHVLRASRLIRITTPGHLRCSEMPQT